MSSQPVTLSYDLSKTLDDLREIFAESERKYPRRRETVDNLALWFSAPLASCDPCGEKSTALSTCTNIDTQTNPTNVTEPSKEAINFDILSMREELVQLRT